MTSLRHSTGTAAPPSFLRTRRNSDPLPLSPTRPALLPNQHQHHRHTPGVHFAQPRTGRKRRYSGPIFVSTTTMEQQHPKKTKPRKGEGRASWSGGNIVEDEEWESVFEEEGSQPSSEDSWENVSRPFERVVGFDPEVNASRDEVLDKEMKRFLRDLKAGPTYSTPQRQYNDFVETHHSANAQIETISEFVIDTTSGLIRSCLDQFLSSTKDLQEGIKGVRSTLSVDQAFQNRRARLDQIVKRIQQSHQSIVSNRQSLQQDLDQLESNLTSTLSDLTATYLERSTELQHKFEASCRPRGAEGRASTGGIGAGAKGKGKRK